MEAVKINPANLESKALQVTQLNDPNNITLQQNLASSSICILP